MSADLVASLACLVGPAQVLTGPEELAPYLTDWRGRYRGAARCVVRPGTTDEVAAVVGACAAAGVPMVPQGGNTGLCGGATPAPDGNAVLITLGRLNRLRTVDAANRALTAEAGCTLTAIQDAAAAVGCLFPLSLASQGSCQIGGNLSTNAGGVQVLRYGTARDLVLGIEAVLPDGRLWNGLRALRKDNTGYDLKQLFIGAEGTLGIITAASLKLFPRPAVQATAWIKLPHPEAAVALLAGAQQAFDARLTAFELVSEAALALVMRHIPGARRPTAVAPWYVLAEVSAVDGAAPLVADLEAWLAGALAKGLVGDAAIAQSAAQAQALWHLRESISEAQKIEGVSIKHDIAVPVSRIPEFLARAGALVESTFPGLRVVAFGHVGDGNLHYNLSRAEAEGNAAFVARQEEVHRCVHDLVHDLGGSISAEHGLGQLKRDEIRRYKSEVELALMASVKAALDPRGLMNPGKVL
ncbi:MAG: FAD-binding oxidoreductase [Azonexus sp.]|nr:FAD-binding oxidoreductase [Betaproteobacteria bacterium]MBK8918276.1 FAD-binding oxidoreductase [Betaproteobacteria bacterium]MBP6036174.1 FAD-binding oxidoreductase [Azonexus sp.]MBP6906697.1 FAD-binding oxidoreductase [Azonexus sp.]